MEIGTIKVGAICLFSRGQRGAMRAKKKNDLSSESERETIDCLPG